MQAFDIQDVRALMSALLTGSAFHHFEVVEAAVTTFVTFRVDGQLHRDFSNTGEADGADITADAKEPGEGGTAPSARFASWKLLQPRMYELIRGKQPPLGFKLILRLSDENTRKVLLSSHIELSPESVSGLYLNISFEGGKASCVTGTSLNVFTMDKALEHSWDELAARLLRREKIAFLPG